jgi:hypothetical protein
MEVSMPTGSLCAERNVIGTALSADITLRREDIKLVAVYAASMPAPTPMHRTASTSSALERSSSVGNGAFSQQNSIILGGSGEAGEGEDQQNNGAAAMMSPLRVRSTSGGGSGGGGDHLVVDTTLSPILTSDPASTCLPCTESPRSPSHRLTRSESDPGPPSQANTPLLGTPSPQHPSSSIANGENGVFPFTGAAKSPQALGKRKILSISQQFTATAATAADGSSSAGGDGGENGLVRPSAAPVGLKRRPPAGGISSTTSGTAAMSTTSASTSASNNHKSTQRTKTRTVAFSASSNNLAAQRLIGASSDCLTSETSFLGDDGNTSALALSPNASMVDMSAVSAMGEHTAGSHVQAACFGIFTNRPINSETITVDKE